MEIGTTCPACNEADEISVDLRRVNDMISAGNYDQVLNIGDLEIYFKPITYRTVNQNNQVQLEQQQAMQLINSDADEKIKIDQLNKSIAVINETTLNTVAQSIAAIKTPQAMVTETEFIVDFLKNCDSKKFNQLRDYVIGLKQASEVKPLDLICKECSHKYKQAFTLDLSSFFEDAS
jgi:hypothetical protein